MTKFLPPVLRTGLRLMSLPLALLLCQTLSAAVTFTVTPTSVSNTYTGIITLQIGGLTNMETVLVEKFHDVNGNGLIDAGDTEVQQFQLTDGQASVFYDGTTAVTKFNGPGDLTPADGAITAQLYPALWGAAVDRCAIRAHAVQSRGPFRADHQPLQRH
jgi:hypothetical protein